MTLDEFFAETRGEIAAQMSDGSPFAELVFSEVVMQHLVDAGMTFEPVVCHFQGKVGNANLRLSGYAMSEEADQLDLFVSLYEGFEGLQPIPEQDVKTAAAQCVRFLELCAAGRIADKLDPSRGYDSRREIEISRKSLREGYRVVKQQQEAYLRKEGTLK